MTPERWQEVEKFFQLAVARAGDERGAFLDEACAGDPELRQEVESLLAYRAKAPDFLETPVFNVAAALRADDQPLPSLIGQRIGPYRVLREIGHGGMGTVYLAARADDAYQKQVAIKLVKGGVDSDTILRRFRQEQQILADLDHPNIARLIDGGATEDGLSDFIMEYVEGLAIDAYCDRHKPPIAERLRLFRTVCLAVHYAHQNHIIHRDLKPSNILVTAGGAPKLLDFGIAKVLSPDGSTPTTTATPRAMTLEYASPEQVRGGAITPASDVYSLGLLLYELLTGHRPYRVLSHTPQAIERAICEQAPERPSTMSRRMEEIPSADGTPPLTITPESVSATRGGPPEKLRRRLIGDLDNIVLMALRKEPERRYTSVEQFSEDIRRHLEGQPVIARKDTFGYRSAKLIKRNKASVIAASCVLMMLLAVIGVEFYRLPRRDPATRKTVDSAAVLARANLALSEPINLGSRINSEFDEAEPAISPNGLSFYFTSDRSGGLGGYDIWVSRRARLADPWGEPKNLGPAINSHVNEYTPAFSPDGHSLYFASARPGGCGNRGPLCLAARGPGERVRLGTGGKPRLYDQQSPARIFSLLLQG